MMKKYNSIVSGILILLVIVACDFKKMPLPVANQTAGGFGANDTSYIELNPIWESSFLGIDLNYPTDITVGPDGYIFLADQGNDRIVVMNKSGQVLSHNGLNSIGTVEGPSGVFIDQRLNLFVANGTNTVYSWNQYFNTVGIDSVASKIVVKHQTTGDTLHVELDEMETIPDADQYVLDTILYEPYSEEKFPVKELTEFYVDNTAGTKINDIASDGEFLYLTDSENQRIIKLGYLTKYIVMTQNRMVLIFYKGYFVDNCVGYGTGAGTVDGPWSITTDNSNIYFSQLGGNFKVQKLDNENFSSQFTLYVDPIMDLERFLEPRDVALDEVGNLFVMDAGTGQVSKFTQDGKVANLGSSGVAVAEFNDAQSLMVSEDVIYVVESGENRIRRFQYSISDEDIPDDDKKP